MQAIFALILTIPLLSGVPAQERLDRIILNDGTAREGRVVKETETLVTIKSEGKTVSVPTADIHRIEYFDMPASYGGIFGALEEARYTEALGALRRAVEDVEKMEKKDRPRSWFKPAILYYSALCNKETANAKEALQNIDTLLKTHKGNRFIRDILQWKVECHLAEGDTAGAEETIKEMKKMGTTLGSAIVARAELLQAQQMLVNKEYDRAKVYFDRLSNHSDPEVSGPASLGAVRARAEGSRPEEVVKYCEKILNTMSARLGTRLVAANALGDVEFKKGNHREATSYYVKAVALFHPGRRSSLTREHETAILNLARCYEKLADGASADKARRGFVLMAISTYRELSVLYASGSHRQDALDAIVALEKTRTELEKKIEESESGN